MKIKNIVSVALVVLIASMLFVVSVFAQGLLQTENPTSDVQLYFIGLASLAIIYVIKLITTRFPNVNLTRAHVSVLIYVVAIGLSFYFGGFVFPAFAPFADPLTFVNALFGFINALLLAMAPSVSLATLFYNLILKRVFDAGAVKVGLIETPKTEPVMVAKK